MDHDETGCQAPPERPILCINNCGFFGSAATMNMCSKCHKDLLVKQEQAKPTVSPAANILTVPSSSNLEQAIISETVDVQPIVVETKAISVQPSCALGSVGSVEEKPKEGPNRCTACNKRVGLTGFKCRCGNFFCASHRYSDKHNCQFDYRNAAREAIARANPVVRAEKLDKI